MTFTRKLLVSAVFLAVAVEAQATNGYFTHGLGVINKSMAGAGTATPQEAIAIANNPASAVLLGDAFEVGLSIFSPRRQYTASASLANGNGGAFTIAPGKVESGSEYFPIPYIAKTWALQNDTAAGLTLYGRGGMNTDYTSGAALFDPDGPGPSPVVRAPGPFGNGNAGVDLSQLFAEAAYAGKFNDKLAWGVSAILVAQSFEAKGVGSFAPYTSSFARSGGRTMPTKLSNNGHDLSTGYGAKIGVQWQPLQNLRTSLSYQSVISTSEFDDYGDLFAEQGGFDIPANIRFGLSWDYSNSVTLHYDIDHTSYSDIDSVGNPVSNIFRCPTAGAGGTDVSACLGGNNGAGFGWKDVTVHKLGVAWKAASLPQWTFRAGVSHGQQPIEPSEVLFNMLAPGVVERHFTVGGTWQRADGKQFSAALLYAPEGSVSGRNSFDPTQRLELKMHQFEIEFGLSW